MNSTTYLFADEVVQKQELPEESWKILIVDDEPEVHAVTKLALSDFHFLGRGLEFYSAYSGAEACDLIQTHPDAAIVLLDVVMETDDAGLNVARYIRDELGNRYTRIILRTGQPGQAPERTVIVNYDINDYKSKTELTAQKLFTAVMASLRSYRDIISIVHSRDGLEKVIASMHDLFALQSMDHFISGLVQQLGWLIGGARQTLYATLDKRKKSGELSILAAYGEDADQLVGQPIKAALPKETLVELTEVMNSHSIYYADDFVLAYCPSKYQPQGALLCLTGLSQPLNDKERELLEVFAANVQVALDNTICAQDNDALLVELMVRLAELEQETYALYPKRRTLFANIVAQLADLLALPAAVKQQLGTAAGLYERIESLFIPTAEQDSPWLLPYQQRLLRAIQPLQNIDNEIIAVVVRALSERLERYDGLGLPYGKQGQEIALATSILCVARLFYELAQQDIALEDISARLAEERGSYFPPELIDLMAQHAHTLYELVVQQQQKASS